VSDTSGRGLQNCLVPLTFDSTGISATTTADYDVFGPTGERVPFYLVSPDNAASKLWVAVNVPPSGTVTFHVWYGAAIANTVTAQALDMTGIDPSASSLTSVTWNDLRAYLHPDRPWSWRLGKTGKTVEGRSYGLKAISSSAVTFGVGADGTYRNDYDSVIITVGTAAGTSSALTGLRRDDDGSGQAGNFTGFVRYRVAGSSVWSTAWSTTTFGAAVTTAIDLDNAVEIALGIEATDNTGVAAMTIDTATTIALALIGTPTVSVGSASNGFILSGALTLGDGQTVTFNTIYLTAALVIDTHEQAVSVASGPAPMSPNGGTGVSFNRGWTRLPVGSTTWTGPTGATAAFAWRSRVAV
jgi:hypothetical protein